ncbi:MAG: tetratricopeptide repeat protein, partial [Zestosphaera sp.]
MPNTIEEIEETINKALKVAEEIKNDYERSVALTDVAEAFAETGDIDKAKEIINKALKVAEEIKNDYERSVALATIAMTFAETGDIDKAKEIINKALKVAERIKDDYERSVALRPIAMAFAKIGDINKALKVAEEIKDDYERSVALAAIAMTFAKIGDIDKAKEIINKALKVAERIKNDYLIPRTLAVIAVTFAKIGDIDKAKEIINKALKVAERIKNDYLIPRTLELIAMAFSRVGDINKALKVAEEIKDDYGRSVALADVAEAFAETGDIDKAKEIINKALKVAERIKNEYERSRALMRIAMIMKEIPVLSVEITKLVLFEEDYIEVVLNSNVTVENVIVEFEGLNLKPVKIEKLENEQLLRLKPPFEPGKKKLKVKISFDYKGKRLFLEREFVIELKSARKTEIFRKGVIIADQQRVVVQRKVEDKIFSKYKLIELVGSGAFADVYKAHDENGNIVALKIYREDDKAFLEEIGNFVQLTKRLNIPYVVKPLDYGSSPKPYVVMEYYPMTLRGLLRRDIELKKKLKFMYRLAKALSYAHQRGIYHGDLKPENILVREENGEYYPAIADWGGGYTLGYSAPEVVKSGGKILNSKSDVYSLGVILYELLTGQKLFKDLLDYLERAENVKVTLQDKELEDLINASLSKPEHR